MLVRKWGVFEAGEMEVGGCLPFGPVVFTLQSKHDSFSEAESVIEDGQVILDFYIKVSDEQGSQKD